LRGTLPVSLGSIVEREHKRTWNGHMVQQAGIIVRSLAARLHVSGFL
jgi:hypothetical protein